MKKTLYLIILLTAAFSTKGIAQDSPIFPRGAKSPNVHHTGDVWLKELNESDSTFTFSIAVASFAPGAKLNWHFHPGGQILIVTSGSGYYQERGKPKHLVHKGETIKCLPNIEHWHGATADDEFTYIATSPTQKGKTVWLEAVTDAEYKKQN